MRFGVVVRNSGADAVRQVRELPRIAEELGFDSVWVSDHLLVPPSFAERYDENWLEATVAAGAAVAATSRIRVGFSALVLPYRQAAVVARQIESLGDLSGRRLVVGAGSGWLREEFEALGLDFRERGRATDDGVMEIRAACDAEILAAGNGTGVLQRAAKLCDGWHPIALSPAEIVARKAALDSLAGRPMRVVLRTRFSFTADRDRPLYGSTAKIRFDVERYAAAGVDELVLDHAARTHGEIVDSVRRFAAEVMA